MSIKLFVKYEEVSQYPAKFCIRENKKNANEFDTRYQLKQYLTQKYGDKIAIDSEEPIDNLMLNLKTRKLNFMEQIKNYFKSDFNKLKRTTFIKIKIA